MIVLSYLAVTLFGLVMGSFAGASVWRIRAYQIVSDKKMGEAYDKTELKRLLPLTKETVVSDRSRCLNCGHELTTKDLIPLFSWLNTRGRCRYCGKKIGKFEPAIELATAASFIVVFQAWNAAYATNALGVTILIIGFVITVLMVILLAYDAKWFILPDIIVFPLVIIGMVYAGYSVISSADPIGILISILLSLLILSGLYFSLWLYSKGQWVGFGDVKLGVALALLLVDWKLAFLALFLANFIGTLIVIPGLVRKTMGRQTQIPFGPLLIIGFAISALYGQQLIHGYESAVMWILGFTLMV